MRKWLIIAGSVLVVLLIVDRVTPLIAASVVSDQIKKETPSDDDPDVTFHGFPFLSQVLVGDYRDVDVVVHGVDTERLSDVTVRANLRGVKAPLSDLIRGDINELPVETVSGTATISYDELARASGVPGLSISPDGDMLRLAALLPINGMPTPITARAKVDLQGDQIVVTAQDAIAGGRPIPESVLAVADIPLTFTERFLNLPFDLRLTNVRIAEEGISVSAAAHDVVLRG